MKRFLLLSIPALFAAGCSTESHLLEPIHTPRVEVSSERPAQDRDSGERRPAAPTAQHEGALGPWRWP